MFRVNPLSLCLPQSTFEAWLRESGHLEILDKCIMDRALVDGHGAFSAFIKALKINPFRSLTVEDLCKSPVPWTEEFFDCGLGPRETYSCPHSVMQAKLRIEENAKRYTGNYMVLSLIIFMCFLYKMPIAVLGIVSILALWDTVRVYINSRGLTLDSFHCRCLQLVANIATMFMMVYCKVAVALAWAGLTSFVGRMPVVNVEAIITDRASASGMCQVFSQVFTRIRLLAGENYQLKSPCLGFDYRSSCQLYQSR